MAHTVTQPDTHTHTHTVSHSLTHTDSVTQPHTHTPCHTSWVSLPGGAARQEPTASTFHAENNGPLLPGLELIDLFPLKFPFVSVHCRSSQLGKTLPSP